MVDRLGCKALWQPPTEICLCLTVVPQQHASYNINQQVYHRTIFQCRTKLHLCPNTSLIFFHAILHLTFDKLPTRTDVIFRCIGKLFNLWQLNFKTKLAQTLESEQHRNTFLCLGSELQTNIITFSEAYERLGLPLAIQDKGPLSICS